MKAITSDGPSAGIESMSVRIADALNAGRSVLWLVCGGSNVAAAVAAMERIHALAEPGAIELLTVGLTDERYGPVGHADSNWQQLVDAGLNLRKVSAMPVLIGRSLEATVVDYAERLERKLGDIRSTGGLVVALFGIGADGHIAGALPGSPAALEQKKLVVGYRSDTFVRITIAPVVFGRIDVAYALVFGASKKAALERLTGGDLPIAEQPAQLLKQVPEAWLYSDCV